MINQLVRKARKFLAPSASPAQLRNDYYYNRIYFKRILHFFKTYKESQENAIIKLTIQPISPLGLRFGSSTESVKKALGTPKYVYDNGNKHNHHQVFFFRKSFTAISLLVQVQFYNDRAFFIGLDVVKRMIDEQEKSEILNTVIQKYLNEPFVPGNNYPVIQDEEGNFVVINNDVNFSICYLGGGIDEEKQKKIIKSMDEALIEKSDKSSLFYAF